MNFLSVNIFGLLSEKRCVWREPSAASLTTSFAQLHFERRLPKTSPGRVGTRFTSVSAAAHIWISKSDAEFRSQSSAERRHRPRAEHRLPRFCHPQQPSTREEAIRDAPDSHILNKERLLGLAKWRLVTVD